MNVMRIPRSELDKLLLQLNDFARSQALEYGLPMVMEQDMAYMREIVREWLHEQLVPVILAAPPMNYPPQMVKPDRP